MDSFISLPVDPPASGRIAGDGVPWGVPDVDEAREPKGLARARDLMLVDLDAFYVSVEQRRDPSLCGRPVIVGGGPGDRGVVASASYEARGYGVRAGMPLRRAAALCPKAVFLDGDHADYAAASAEVFGILREFSPRVEPVSLDEAFLDLTGCDRLHLSLASPAVAGVSSRRRPARTWLDAAEDLHRLVRARAGLSVSIGIGGTKAVASVAAALAKPAGAIEVPRGEEAAFLAGLPVETLPGVGPKTREALARFNLHTVGDLARIPEDLLEETFGRVGVSLSRRARGLEADAAIALGPRRPGDTADDGPVGDGRPRPKSISRETSFAEDTADRAVVAGMLSYLAQRATAALRGERLLCRGVVVRLRYSDFKTVEARRRLAKPTDLDRDVLAAVDELWPKRWDRRVRLRLVGVGLVDLEPVGERQLDLFSDSSEPAVFEAGRRLNVPGSGTLDDVLDRLRRQHGFGAIVRGQSVGCLSRVRHDDRGFRLRTPSCSA